MNQWVTLGYSINSKIRHREKKTNVGSTWILQSFKVRSMSYMRPFWSTQWIWRKLCEGLSELSIFAHAFCALIASKEMSLLGSSILNSSLAVSGGREENPCWKPSTNSISQKRTDSPKLEPNFSHVSSCLFLVCRRSLRNQVISQRT